MSSFRRIPDNKYSALTVPARLIGSVGTSGTVGLCYTHHPLVAAAMGVFTISGLLYCAWAGMQVNLRCPDGEGGSGTEKPARKKSFRENITSSKKPKSKAEDLEDVIHVNIDGILTGYVSASNYKEKIWNQLLKASSNGKSLFSIEYKELYLKLSRRYLRKLIELSEVMEKETIVARQTHSLSDKEKYFNKKDDNELNSSSPFGFIIKWSNGNRKMKKISQTLDGQIQEKISGIVNYRDEDCLTFFYIEDVVGTFQYCNWKLVCMRTEKLYQKENVGMKKSHESLARKMLHTRLQEVEVCSEKSVMDFVERNWKLYQRNTEQEKQIEKHEYPQDVLFCLN